MDSLIIFIFGLFIGSFLGVLVDRIPKGKQVLFGRSKCEFCHKNLNWLELIPVVSFVIQEGKCNGCKRKLSFFYPVIEITTGVLFVLTYFFTLSSTPSGINLVFYLLIVSSLIVIFFIDLKYGVIPNKLIFPSILITFFWLLVNNSSLVHNHLLTAILSLLFFASIAFLYYLIRKKESLGGGDIKMAFLMGLLLGFPNVITAFYIAFLTGATYSLILILWGRLKLKDAIPFGPFLVLGTLIALFLGEQILSLMLPLLGL